MTFTYAEKLAEAKREVAMRRNVYPGFVARKKMKQVDADRHLAIMEAIVGDYEKAVARTNVTSSEASRAEDQPPPK